MSERIRTIRLQLPAYVLCDVEVSAPDKDGFGAEVYGVYPVSRGNVRILEMWEEFQDHDYEEIDRLAVEAFAKDE